LTLVLMGTLVYYGWLLTVFTTQPTSTLYVPMSVVYVVVPMSALVIMVRSVGVLIEHIRIAARGSESAA
jgi:TRAP-type C4-dicarboxylate transport system permease small subunit